MKKEKKLRIQEYFEGIELTEEYEPYFCSVEAAITIVIVGTFCGFRNLKQIREWASHEKIKAMLLEEFGVKYVPCYYRLTHLLKIVDPKSMNECFTQLVTKHTRAEWSVETMHWLLDVRFREDSCRVQNENIQLILNMVRKIVINSLRFRRDKHHSKRAFSSLMLDCLINPSFVKSLLQTQN
jgi:hypothetical protein